MAFCGVSLERPVSGFKKQDLGHFPNHQSNVLNSVARTDCNSFLLSRKLLSPFPGMNKELNDQERQKVKQQREEGSSFILSGWEQPKAGSLLIEAGLSIL